MGLVLSVYSLSVITQVNKQASNTLCWWYKRSSSTCNTILQYLRDCDHNDDNNINYKNNLQRWLCTSSGKMTHKENLDQSENHF